jgi:outer membrane usher protein FimD/PapC
MANVFKNAKLYLSASAQDIYTVPSSTTSIIFSSHVTNISASAQSFTLTWTDSSDSDFETYLADEFSVPFQAAYEPVGKLILESGDKLKGFAGSASALQITLSILEQS